jgi:hypothetical protein
MIGRDRPNVWELIGVWRLSILPHIAPQLVCSVLWSCFIVWISTRLSWATRRWTVAPFTLLGVALSTPSRPLSPCIPYLTRLIALPPAGNRRRTWRESCGDRGVATGLWVNCPAGATPQRKLLKTRLSSPKTFQLLISPFLLTA